MGKKNLEAFRLEVTEEVTKISRELLSDALGLGPASVVANDFGISLAAAHAGIAKSQLRDGFVASAAAYCIAAIVHHKLAEQDAANKMTSDDTSTPTEG